MNRVPYRAALLGIAAFLFLSTTAGAAPRPGQAAPSFKAFAISGQPISIESLRGSVVILDFWATWCPPCRESIPFFSELHRKYGKQGLQIVGMSVDESGEKHLKAFVAEKGIPYSIALASEKVQTDYGIRALPVLFVIDKNGIVKEQMLGFSASQAKSLENLIKKLLAN